MANICEICNARPAAAQLTVVQDGERKSMSICEYDYCQLMRHQSIFNPFDSLLGGGLSGLFTGLEGMRESSLKASAPRESVNVTDAFSQQTLELLHARLKWPRNCTEHRACFICVGGHRRGFYTVPRTEASTTGHQGIHR